MDTMVPRAPPKRRWLAAAKVTPRAYPSISQPPGENWGDRVFPHADDYVG
jgi:hypothetical protein